MRARGPSAARARGHDTKRRSRLEILGQILAVAGLGAVTLWGAIPVGLALGLGPWATGASAAVGAVLGVLPVFAVGDRLRSGPLIRLANAATRRHGLMYRTWASYGAPGLGLLAPLLLGAPLGAAMGIILGAPLGRLLFWTTLGIVFWSAALTFAGALGLTALQR